MPVKTGKNVCTIALNGKFKSAKMKKIKDYVKLITNSMSWRHLDTFLMGCEQFHFFVSNVTK